MPYRYKLNGFKRIFLLLQITTSTAASTVSKPITTNAITSVTSAITAPVVTTQPNIQQSDGAIASGSGSGGMDTPKRIGVISHQHTSLLRSFRKLVEFTKTEEFMDLTMEGIHLRRDRLMDLWKKINESHLNQIEDATEAAVEELENRMDEAEGEYFDGVETMNNRYEELQPQPEQVDAAGVNEQLNTEADRPINVNVKLPMQQHDMKNTWGTFNGEPLNWLGFRDKFMDAIHNNPDVTDAYKLSYLEKSLVGQAKERIRGWNVYQGSYQDAWDRFYNHYNKKFPIKRAYLDRLFELKPVRSESVQKDLQDLANIVHETIRQLRGLEEPVDQWDTIIVHMVNKLLDEATARAWELQRDSDMPTIKGMLEFLDKRAEALRNVKGSRDHSTSSSHRGSTQSIKEKPMDSQQKFGTVNRPKFLPCQFCDRGSQHASYFCPDYLGLSLNGRKDLVMRRRLCMNCLRPGHGKNSCTEGKCPMGSCATDPAHNSTLCPNKVKTKQVLTVKDHPDVRKEKDRPLRKCPSTEGWSD